MGGHHEIDERGKSLWAHLDRVRAVGHNLRLDDGHEAIALADGRVAREVADALGDGNVGGEALRRVDLRRRGGSAQFGSGLRKTVLILPRGKR